MYKALGMLNIQILHLLHRTPDGLSTTQQGDRKFSSCQFTIEELNVRKLDFMKFVRRHAVKLFAHWQS
ncbi:hypothetical protein [Vibrio harveyi]|uniref:hypothetical protein n=1 Tax=Vibrio harveyi TaxID=669 RepID=UPI000C7B934F|nr:hypothetical protein [Vibrio harveyi]